MALGPIVEAVVGTRDVAASVAFAAAVFGLAPVEALGPSALLGVPGVATGRVRFESAPGDEGHQAPELWEIGPRLLGIYSRDLVETKRRVEAAGAQIGPITSYPYGTSMQEAVVRGPGDLFWTVPQVTPRRPSPALDADPHRLHGELHSAVINVDDMDGAVRFFADAGGLVSLFDGTLKGEPFERMMGLPKGASLRIAFLSSTDQAPARLELMQFFDVPTAPLRHRSVGLTRLSFACPASDQPSTRARLVDAGAARDQNDRLRGPAGIVIELVET
jgi:catechol 2,3-dioxygenase-like lactoylglutathione lyase family enzyme